MHVSPRTRGPNRRTLAGFAAAVALVALIPAAQPAAANPPGPHDPFGSVSRVVAVEDAVTFSGWAADPDEPATNVTIGIIVDGRRLWSASTPTTLARPLISSKYGLGPTPGFSLTTPPLGSTPHTVCLFAQNLDLGLGTILKCVATPLGTTLSAEQRATHSPRGVIQRAGARSAALRFVGWATDPDYVARRSVVVLYVDGTSVATVVTHRYPAPRPAGAGSRSAFEITVPVSSGTHIGCIWVVNIGFGSNTFLGCKARDTRGPAGTGDVTVPRLNKQVVGEALTHIGQPYVWGAEGPAKFDCSGLVMYSYGKFGFTTPRVSEDQAAAARLIPASRAVPGDLAFYHDRVGDVYHVGIVLGPGKTVAAIDTDRGVDYQDIWDPTVTTYGSFTHT
jgi:hypothetical protein